MNSQDKQYSEINFPERLFVLGAGPSLELLYPYREEMENWGHWAVQRVDLVQPFLEFIDPLYNIGYWPHARRVNKGYGIPLETPRGDLTTGGTIGGVISQFQKFGGKELFLFGYDGTSSGYWRDNNRHPSGGPVSPGTFEQHIKDRDAANKLKWDSTKVYHLGKTRNSFMTEISIEELKRRVLE
jgi:hypothetical protein